MGPPEPEAPYGTGFTSTKRMVERCTMHRLGGGAIRQAMISPSARFSPAPRNDAVDGSLPRRRCAKRVSGETRMREPPMSEISIIGLDLAKQVFQIHAADSKGRCLVRKQLKRRELLAFFAGLGLASSPWRRAAQPITGRGRSRSLAMKFGCCLRPTSSPT